MAREQVGTAPSRPDDAATVAWVQEQLSVLAAQQQTQKPWVNGEVPTGDLDGTNVLFSTFYDFVPGTTSVFVNGLREALGVTYTEQAPNTLELSAPLISDDDILVTYQREN